MAKFKQKCSRCRKNYVIITRRENYPICYECQKSQLQGDIEDPAMKKLFDIPEELYKENMFLRNIKISYLKYQSLTEKQIEALEQIQKNVLDKFGSTGVQEVLDKSVFDLLNYIAIFPAGSKLSDSKGNILPDCFLLPSGSTALDFAYYLHTDIGDKFIKAIDVRTKQPVGKDHALKHRDGIEIMTS